MSNSSLNYNKQLLALLAIATSCPFVQGETAGTISPSQAAGTSAFGSAAIQQSSGIREREAARRESQAQDAWLTFLGGRDSFKEGKYSDALDKYQRAWDMMPKAPATARQQETIKKNIGDASIAVAMQYAKTGRYDDAQELLLDVISREPNNKLARKQLNLLRDPIRNNPALTPEHVSNVDEVNRLLSLAWGYYEIAQYDAAYNEFSRILVIDPYNMAASRGQEAVSARRSAYYRVAYDTARSTALAAVDAMWVPRNADTVFNINTQQRSSNPISEESIQIESDLESFTIPQVNFEDTPIREALRFLTAEAKKHGIILNIAYTAPKKAAVVQASVSDDEEGDEMSAPIVSRSASDFDGPDGPTIQALELTGITGKELLDKICDQTECETNIEGKFIEVYKSGSGNGKIEQRQWKNVPRSFFKNASGGSSDDGDDFMDSGDDSAPSDNKIDAVAALIPNGVKFGSGTSAHYSSVTGVLTVNNSPAMLDMVSEAIDAARRNNSQNMVKVQAKIVEITQQNDEELGFDWAVNPFSINDSGNTFLGGGGSAGSTDNFLDSGGSAFDENYNGDASWPIKPNGGGAVGDVRSGSQAVTSNRLSSLISAGSTTSGASTAPAPGILSLTGIFDSGSYQMIMRGLSQKKGVDIMSAPSLVTKPGELSYVPVLDPLDQGGDEDNGAARIEVIRRFVYPSEYDPPTVGTQNNNNNNNNDNNNGGGGNSSIVTPSSPAAWSVENVGVTLRFQINESDTGSDIIEFHRFEVKIVEFEGFINYGSPIYSSATNEEEILRILLTENRIDMPIFNRRYINTNPCIYDGHTIVIGGLIDDKIQRVEDKVPILGDLPFIGRFFRSDAESHSRSNMMIFVTAEYIDPTGKPVRHRTQGTLDSSSMNSAPSLFPGDI